MTDDERKTRNREYQRKYREKNRDMLREYWKDWASRNPDKMEKIRAKQIEPSRLRARRWREDPGNRQMDIESSRQYYQDNKAEIYAKNRARILKNHDAYLEYMTRYAAKNAERASTRARQWKIDNPEKVKLNSGKRKALKMQTQTGPIDYREIIARDKWVCGICAGQIEGAFHFDHIIPLARGGSHTQDNLQMAHPRCNLSKKDRLPKKTPKGL